VENIYKPNNTQSGEKNGHFSKEDEQMTNRYMKKMHNIFNDQGSEN
jgi:hypothetical protein